MTVVAITGHRPEKISDFGWVRSSLKEVLTTLRADQLIQGMAAGVDLLSAEVAYELGVPFIAAKPWAGHTPRNADKILYQKVSAQAQEVVDVHPTQNYVGAWVYQKRNEWMVDHATVVVAVWDGTSGGTNNCVKYAKKKNLPIVIIDPVLKTVKYPAEPLPPTIKDLYLF